MILLRCKLLTMAILSLKRGSIFSYVITCSAFLTIFYLFNLGIISRNKYNTDGRLSVGFDFVDLHCQDENRASICIFQDQTMTTRDHFLLKNVLAKCVAVLEEIEGLDYFIHHNSLLGYSRHNKQFIPWDDTVHLALVIGAGETQCARTVSAIGRETRKLFGNEYSTQFNNKTKTLKFFGKTVQNSKQIRSDDPMIFWRWPYVEIQLMVRKGANIVAPTTQLTYRAEDVQPTRLDSLAGVGVRIPTNYESLIKQMALHPGLCQSRGYDTRRETEIAKVETFSCQELDVLTQLKPNGTDDTFPEPTCELGKQMDDPWLCHFTPVLSSSEKKVLLDLLSLATKMLDKMPNTSYFIAGGSLLGYWRHDQKMIPWDDDNPSISMPDAAKWIKKFVSKYYKNLIGIFYNSGIHLLKFYFENVKLSHQIEGFSWRFPFIDIQLMRVTFTGNKIQSMRDFYHTAYNYSADMIYPLKRSEFESIPVSIPGNVEAVLRNNYDIEKCFSHNYSHRKEKEIPIQQRTSRPCSHLKQFYNFTHLNDPFYEY